MACWACPWPLLALPLYVLLPNHYARAPRHAAGHAGAVLLAARLFDAATDRCWWLSDRLFGRSTRTVLGAGAGSAVVLALGMWALFFPPVQGEQALAWWALLCLLATYLAYSQLSIAHQSWGARLGGDEALRSRIVAWREGAAWWGGAGIVAAQLAGPARHVGRVCRHAGAGLVGLGPRPAQRRRVPTCVACTTRPARQPVAALGAPGLPPPAGGVHAQRHCQRHPGHAGAVLRADRLQAPSTQEPLFLGAYFVCAALSIPLWLRAVGRFGLARTWLMGMLLAVAVFAWTALLGSGDALAFAVVCALSGVALAPTWFLAQRPAGGRDCLRRRQRPARGAYFGWWNFCHQAQPGPGCRVWPLPLLALLGLHPGTRSEDGPANP